MAVLTVGANTLLDFATRMDPDGKTSAIAELFAQSNPMLQDMTWVEGNLATGHRATVRTGLPTVGTRLLNSGVSPSKSTTAQIDEDCAIFEAFSEIDVDLAMLNGNTDAFRMSEGVAFIEAMNQAMQQTLLYGNKAANPGSFNGIMGRYNSLSGATSQNIISAGTVTGADAASILLTVWGPNTVHGIFPKGSKAGLVHENLDQQVVQTGTGIASGRMKAFLDRWQWKCGLCVRDWRYVARLANIDTSAVVADTTGATIKLIENMVRLTHRIPNLDAGTPVFYCPRSIRAALDVQVLNKVNSQLTFETFSGRRTTAFQGIPIRTVDQMLETETTVV